ncbi:beta-1 adrenergic receptor-like [Montipora capricornis]|uniref:beta-1 adrenergic receptor-like n=1 Tax=Montipora capricornis TaxID=246305 RepID=UPI0035F12727
MANFTTWNFTNTIKDVQPAIKDESQNVFSVIFIITNIIINSTACPFTVGLNVLVIIALKRRPSLRSNANVMLAYLAVTDVLTGLTSQPFLIVWNISLLVGNEETFGIMLEFHVFCFGLLARSSCLHLMTVVFERLVAIKFPYRYPYVLTKSNIKSAVFFCWIYSALCCTGLFLIDTSSSLYSILASHVPIACVIFVSSSYAVLFSETRRHQKMIKSQSLRHEDVERFLKESKALKTTVLVVAAVGLCFLPGALFLALRKFLSQFENKIHLVKEMTRTLLLINSLLNPLIYCWRQREMRKFTLKPLWQTVNPTE